MKNSIIISSVILLFGNCSRQQKVDLIVHNSVIYTVNNEFSVVEAMAIKDEKIIALGTDEQIFGNYKAEKQVDLQGKPVYPGFHDAHCHFYGYALSLAQLDLVDTRSFEEVLNRVVAYRQKNPEQEWIRGRGWDQNDWKSKELPDNQILNTIFPDVPVFLNRIDGHAAIVNQKALDIAGIKENFSITGGSAVVKNEVMSGVLIDNAAALVSNLIPPPDASEIIHLLSLAERNCFERGLTQLTDAGLDKNVLLLIDSLISAGYLKIKINAMASLTDENLAYWIEKGPYIKESFSVPGFKIYSDGALGSQGACLLKPYHDKSNHYGFLITDPDRIDSALSLLYNNGFQANTHAIGDSANRVMLQLYSKYLQGKNDKRWRIEHAQVIHKDDFSYFGRFSILPSVQPAHCTSDMYWAMDRLGPERIAQAYAYQQLYLENQIIPLGSDFPVEHINPLFGFHSAFARTDAKDSPEGGFQPENGLSRKQALKGMTLDAAYASFNDRKTGSLEVGKKADFTVLDADIMVEEPHKIRQINVLMTFINGKEVYLRP